MKKILILALILFNFCYSISYSQQEIKLYDKLPNEKINTQKEKIQFDKEGDMINISNVTSPRIIVYKPEKPCGTSLIICPGGGYTHLNFKNANNIAKQVNKLGITVFILIYRLPSRDIMNEPNIGPLQDIQAALRIVHKHSTEWNLDTHKIGLLGSSAGGHLAAMAATHFDTSFLANKDTDGLRPDFVVLTWPVISFRSPYVHKGSLTSLLGVNPTEEQIKFYSPDENVSRKTPLTFLVHGSNDPTVSVENSILFYRALRKYKVPSELHIFQNNKHGFGISPEDDNTWMNQLKEWLSINNFI